VKRQDIRKQPILIIDVLELSNQSSTIKLIRPGYPERTIETSLGYGNLPEYYESYHHGLESFKRELQSDRLKQDFNAVANAFRELFETGKVLFESLFEDISGEFEDNLEEIINYLIGHIKAASGSKHLLHPQLGVIEVRTKNIKDIIPIECLVILGSNPEVESLPGVARAASRILGFSFIINRVVGRTRQSQRRELNNVPRLPLKYFYDKSLEGTSIELVFFRENERHFCLDGPWPEEFTESTEKDFVRHLFRPDIGFGQTGKTDAGERQLDEVHHLSCHCHTDEEHSLRYWLQLTGSQPITLKVMRAHLADLKRPGAESQTKLEMPLIFFNACGSSKMTSKGMTSFPEYFLIRNRNCGFVGCETNVPDLFASSFGQQFYLHLIRGFGVGEAVFHARRTMLNRHNNPLGILYMSYVDPYLRVTKAIDIAS
jgi:hypothetical protein